MTRRNGDCRIASTDRAPCAPSRLSGDCLSCIRHAPWTPADPMQRTRTIAIDAASVRKSGQPCQFWAAK